MNIYADSGVGMESGREVETQDWEGNQQEVVVEDEEERSIYVIYYIGVQLQFTGPHGDVGKLP